MNLSRKVASALSFAQMAMVGRANAAKAEDDDEEKKDDAKKAKKAEDDSGDEEAKGAKAESDDEKKDVEGDDDDEKKDAKKAKKAKADDDEEDAKASAVAAHNTRCKAIVAHGLATGQVVHACAYAFDTNMSVDAAVATLDANLALQPAKPQGSSLRERMSTVETPVVRSEVDAPAASSPAALTAQILAAAAKASGSKA